MSDLNSKQIANRNFLSPVGFRFTLAKDPKIVFFCNSARIPEITLGTAIQPTYLKDIEVPEDKLTFGDLTLRFLVDEDMTNYLAVHKWLTGLGFPEIASQFTDLVTVSDGYKDLKYQFSDGSLRILNSNYNETAIIKFKDLFPVSLTSLEFDSTLPDIQYFTAEATFKYTVYTITDTHNKPL